MANANSKLASGNESFYYRVRGSSRETYQLNGSYTEFFTGFNVNQFINLIANRSKGSNYFTVAAIRVKPL